MTACQTFSPHVESCPASAASFVARAHLPGKILRVNALSSAEARGTVRHACLCFLWYVCLRGQEKEIERQKRQFEEEDLRRRSRSYMARKHRQDAEVLCFLLRRLQTASSTCWGLYALDRQGADELGDRAETSHESDSWSWD